MVDPLRIALIGAGGRIANDWRRALEDVPDACAVAFVESDPAARNRLAAAGIPIFASVDAMLHETSIDAAVIATPPASHAAISHRVVGHGAHVLCEKPLAIDPATASAMLAHARAQARVLMMASKFRFVEDVESARRAIAAGDIGEPILYENTFCSVVDMRARWNSDPATSGGGVVIDNGAHAADLARVLVGSIARLFAAAGPRVQPLQVEDSARITFETDRHCVGVATLSWSVFTGDPAYARVHGSEGSIELGWQMARLRRRGSTEWQSIGRGYDKVAAFRNQLGHFVRAVRGAEDPRPGEREALDSVHFVRAAQLSLQEQRWVTLDEVRREEIRP